jgi:hypothetical protein
MDLNVNAGINLDVMMAIALSLAEDNSKAAAAAESDGWMWIDSLVARRDVVMVVSTDVTVESAFNVQTVPNTDLLGWDGSDRIRGDGGNRLTYGNDEKPRIGSFGRFSESRLDMVSTVVSLRATGIGRLQVRVAGQSSWPACHSTKTARWIRSRGTTEERKHMIQIILG